MSSSSKPIEPPSSGPFLTKLLGISLMVLGVGAVIATHLMVPPGHYPAMLFAIPALPFVLLAWRCFQKVGWGTHAPEVSAAVLIQPESVIEAHATRMPRWQLWLIGIGILVVVLFVTAYFFG